MKFFAIIECINKHRVVPPKNYDATEMWCVPIDGRLQTALDLKRPPLPTFILLVGTVTAREISQMLTSRLYNTRTNGCIYLFCFFRQTKGALWCQSHSRKNSHTKNSFGEIISQTQRKMRNRIEWNEHKEEKKIISMRRNQFSCRSLLLA